MRIEELLLLERMLQLFQTEIELRNASFLECIRYAAAKLPGALGEYLKKLEVEHQGRCLRELFRESLEPYWRESNLTKEDIRLFFSFLPEGMTSAKESFLLSIERTLEEIEKRRKQLELVQRQRQKVELCVGAFAGMFLVIILL